MSDRLLTRRNNVRRHLRKLKIDSLLVTAPENVRYLTGFRGSDSYLLVTMTDEVILSDTRFETQLKEECPTFDVVVRRPDRSSMADEVVKAIKSRKLKNVGLEANSISLAAAEKLREELPTVNWCKTDGIVEAGRQVKDADELKVIARAIQVAETAFLETQDFFSGDERRSVTEKDWCICVEFEMRSLGAEGTSFPSIIAAGPKAALPHAIPGSERVIDHSLLLVDWGACVDGYCSDLTRTLILEKPSKKLVKVYETVLAAQQAAIKAIRPGVKAADVDAAARRVIDDAGFGKYFTHGTGHGIGLKVHEAPRLGSRSKETLQAGNVITVEPGIYLPGQLGVRIEDDVLVTKTGAKVLSHLGKTLKDMTI
ncbi:MAG: M24 family metallopeptidase [Thermoguttaceae bacterium]